MNDNRFMSSSQAQAAQIDVGLRSYIKNVNKFILNFFELRTKLIFLIFRFLI